MLPKSGKVHYIVILVVVVTWLGLTLWANNWYTTPGNAEHFTPGDLGSAYSIINVVLTGLIAYFAASAFNASQKQLASMEQDRRFQQCSTMVTEALRQFRKRRDMNKDVFYEAYESTISYNQAENNIVKGKRRVDYRAANFNLKPIAYCCKWMLEQHDGASDENFRPVMVMNALRILGELTSTEQVYLLMATKLEVHNIRTANQDFERKNDSHLVIHKFLTRYVGNELNDCEVSNPGQIARINSMIQSVDWFGSQDARCKFL